MRRVILESPYAATDDRTIMQNKDYARACIRDCLLRNESALASHLLYTQPGILNDDDPEERAKGIAAGHAWLPYADAVVVYTDHGTSPGMTEGERLAEMHGIPIEYRTLE